MVTGIPRWLRLIGIAILGLALLAFAGLRMAY